MTKKIVQYSTWMTTAAFLVMMVWFYMQGYFQDPASLQTLMSRTGLFAPLLFILIQIIQVVIPIIPGGLSCAAGVLAFGPVNGFLYNYIGLVLGSIIAFLLVRQYGRPFILKFVKQEQYDKYIGWLDKGTKFDWFFAAAIFFPCAPDDLLCMIAALTKMSLTKFTLIIVLGKPLALLAYSTSLTTLLSMIPY